MELESDVRWESDSRLLY